MSGRGYWTFYRGRSFAFFAGAEAGIFGFNTLDLAGNGAEYGLFLGGEYQFLPRLGISLDIAPTLINLHSQVSGSTGRISKAFSTSFRKKCWNCAK